MSETVGWIVVLSICLIVAGSAAAVFAIDAMRWKDIAERLHLNATKQQDLARGWRTLAEDSIKVVDKWLYYTKTTKWSINESKTKESNESGTEVPSTDPSRKTQEGA